MKFISICHVILILHLLNLWTKACKCEMLPLHVKSSNYFMPWQCQLIGFLSILEYNYLCQYCDAKCFIIIPADYAREVPNVSMTISFINTCIRKAECTRDVPNVSMTIWRKSVLILVKINWPVLTTFEVLIKFIQYRV